MATDYKTKSQTMFGVAMISIGFVLETLQLTAGRPNFGTASVLAVLTLVCLVSTAVGFVWHRRYKAQSRD